MNLAEKNCEIQKSRYLQGLDLVTSLLKQRALQRAMERDFYLTIYRLRFPLVQLLELSAQTEQVKQRSFASSQMPRDKQWSDSMVQKVVKNQMPENFALARA